MEDAWRFKTASCHGWEHKITTEESKRKFSEKN